MLDTTAFHADIDPEGKHIVAGTHLNIIVIFHFTVSLRCQWLQNTAVNATSSSQWDSHESHPACLNASERKQIKCCPSLIPDML